MKGVVYLIKVWLVTVLGGPFLLYLYGLTRDYEFRNGGPGDLSAIFFIIGAAAALPAFVIAAATAFYIGNSSMRTYAKKIILGIVITCLIVVSIQVFIVMFIGPAPWWSLNFYVWGIPYWVAAMAGTALLKIDR